MRRTRKRLVSALVSSWLIVGAPGTAWAFHAGQTFLDPPGGGGGGGIFFLGRPKERGWNCSMCHEGAPGMVRLRLQSEPDLYADFRYQPGTTYKMTISMEIADGGTERGIGTVANYNSFSAAFEDPTGAEAGLVVGQADKFSLTGNATITSKGTNAGETSWKFTWFAPDATTAQPVTMYFAVVDGNGGGDSLEAFTDPLGDDLLVRSVKFSPATGAMASAAPSELPREPDHASAVPSDTTHDSAPGMAGMVSGLALASSLRRRKRKDIQQEGDA